MQPLCTGRRYKLHGLQRCLGIAERLPQVGKPLRCGAREDRLLGTPVDGIAVFVLVLGQQRAVPLEKCEHRVCALRECRLLVQAR